MNPKDSTSLYLVGPMGAGKSTLGRHLAQVLGRPFYDSDRVIEEKTGADIPWIFDMEGEEGFRRRERDVIDELNGNAMKMNLMLQQDKVSKDTSWTKSWVHCQVMEQILNICNSFSIFARARASPT